MGLGKFWGSIEFKGEICIGQNRRNFFHSFKRLDSALSLFGFAGFGLESVNELLQMCNLVLLL